LWFVPLMTPCASSRPRCAGTHGSGRRRSCRRGGHRRTCRS
jgi:hypothetical protein